MSKNEFKQEIIFGLKNLERIYQNILSFDKLKIDRNIRKSALTYEYIGYYNSIEHLIIRLLKKYKIKIPTGQFFHRDILKCFEELLKNNDIKLSTNIKEFIENLMAFRHVATKIYGFLIDYPKMSIIIRNIKKHHENVTEIFKEFINSF